MALLLDQWVGSGIPFDILGSVVPSQIAPPREAFDPFSLLFGFELCRARLGKDKSYAVLATDFLKALFDDQEVLQRRCQVFTASAILSTVTLRWTFSESAVPLCWFRLSASKAVIATTTDFAPRIMLAPGLAGNVPYRIELMNGERLQQCLKELAESP